VVSGKLPYANRKPGLRLLALSTCHGITPQYSLQQEQQDHSHQLDSTVNDLIDRFGDTGVEEGEFPQARRDNMFKGTNQ
jgi:hypothetical protein